MAAYQDVDRLSEGRCKRGHSKLHPLVAVSVMCLSGAVLGVLVTSSTYNNEGAFWTQDSFADMHATPKERLPWYSKLPLPKKVAVEYVTPRKTQGMRGTCWDFATMGLLEQSYRTTGVENGWLGPEEYVSFSEQAYGKLMIDVCSNPEASDDCRVPGDEVALNSTEGGEVPYLYYLANLLEDKVLPTSVCPYLPVTAPDGGPPDGVCPGFDEAVATNPLLFSLKGMRTMYEPLQIKAELVSTRAGRAMAFSTAIPNTYNFYPCVGARASLPECDPASPLCEPCPSYYTPTACCLRSHHGSCYDLDGQFFDTPSMQMEGGHAMTLVGYNDNFVTRDGRVGGFIIKNSWFDEAGHPDAPDEVRGSHTMAWWMQERSDWDERKVCPNSFNPANWYMCGNVMEVVLKDQEKTGLADSFRNCISDTTVAFAKLNLQPLKLRCIDGQLCDARDSTVYYSTNVTRWGDEFKKRCFFKHDTSDPAAPLESTLSTLCLDPMHDRHVAQILRPVPAETAYNDPDRCGFYFMPYEVVDRYSAQFQGFFVNSFEVQWHPRSYLANAKYYGGINYEGGGGEKVGDGDAGDGHRGKKHHPTTNHSVIAQEEKKFFEGGGADKHSVARHVLDYGLLAKSTRTQRSYRFSGPFPNADVV